MPAPVAVDELRGGKLLGDGAGLLVEDVEEGFWVWIESVAITL